jgi:hypothetical protein
MHKNKNDVLTGCIAIAIFAGLSALAGGLKILAYTGWLIGLGMLILFLLQLKRQDATTVAVILMPIILLRKFFVPKKLRGQLKELKSGDKSARP